MSIDMLEENRSGDNFYACRLNYLAAAKLQLQFVNSVMSLEKDTYILHREMYKDFVK